MPTSRTAKRPIGTGQAGKSIVWLASYPKSGNTWARIFIGNYLWNADTPMPINKVNQIGIADSAASIYRAVAGGAFNPADPNQALMLRERALLRLVSNGADVNFVKTHNFAGSVLGTNLIPVHLTRSAICIIRDPRDVAVSYARHFGYTPAQAVASIGKTTNTTAGGGQMVKQFLGTWSDHVKSWSEARTFPVLAVRYEDMKADPRTAFAKVVRHIGIPFDQDQLDRAIKFSAFDELRRQEEKEPFVEQSSKSARFFHSGTSGQWADVLSPEEVAQIEHDHGRMMRKFGYLEK